MGSMTAEPVISFPPKVYAEAVVRSACGESLLRSKQAITRHTVDQFHATDGDLQRAATDLQRAGFEVLDIGRTSVNIAAPAEVYGAVLKARLETVERPTTRDLSQPGVAEFINSQDQSPFGEIDLSNTGWEDLLDGVAINAPAYYLQGPIPKATPPLTSKPYLQVPTDLAMELRATLAHGQGITGKGVKVAVVDSGCYTQHPFFQHHSYHLQAVLGPGSANPEEDENGHGTGVVANLLAIAPEVDLTLVKADVALASKSRNINSTAAFRAAVALKPDVISCSWGSDLRSPYYLSSFHRVLASAIADAVNQGILVVCAAGNGQWGFPSQHPDVIAVGGVFKHLEGSLKGRLEASNYASSFISAIYPDRRVPDVCGLVGQLPSAAYIMLPVSPGSEIDQLRALTGDETETTDGWAAFSGTSSAAPQVAGGCALLRQAAPGLGPFELRQVLEETARDIGEGYSNVGTGGAQARDGPDLATGYGLVDVERAVRVGKGKIPNREEFVLGLYGIGKQPPFSITRGNLKQVDKNISNQYLRREKVIDLDNSVLRQLRKKIDEIQIDLNTYLRETLLARTALKDIQLIINEKNFIEIDSQFLTTSFFLNTLRELVVEKREEVNCPDSGIIILGNLRDDIEFEALIRKKHIVAAESLLKRSLCEEIAKNILLKATKLSGVKLKIEILGIGEILDEDCGKIEMTPSTSEFFIVSGISIPSSESSAETIIRVGNKNYTIDDLKGKLLKYNKVDLDEIAEMAAIVLNNFEVDQFQKSNYSFFDCDGDCCMTRDNKYWNRKNRKTYESITACKSGT